MEKKNGKLIAEIVCYIVSGLVALWGIAYIVVGQIARYSAHSSDIVNSNNAFKAVFGLDFFGWGLIILAIGAIFATIILCVRATGADRDYEKNQRRSARLAQMKEARRQKEEPVIEVPSEPVEK